MLIKTAFQLASPAGKHARLSVLIFHRVFPEIDPLFPDEPDIERFDAIVAWVANWFNVLPLDEAVICLKRGTLPARAAAITFDDGYADNLSCAAPVLCKHGVSATFFIATGFLDGGRMWNDTIIESIRTASQSSIDCAWLGLGSLPLQDNAAKRRAISKLLSAIKHQEVDRRADSVARVAEVCTGKLPNDLMLTRQQVRMLRAKGMGIGAHTVSHPILLKLNDDDARSEIGESREDLQAILRERVSLFAYPNGKLGSDYTDRHAQIVLSLGFDAAFATNWATANSNSNPFQIPRFTPWDKSKWRFAMRLILNNHTTDPATVGLSNESEAK